MHAGGYRASQLDWRRRDGNASSARNPEAIRISGDLRRNYETVCSARPGRSVLVR